MYSLVKTPKFLKIGLKGIDFFLFDENVNINFNILFIIFKSFNMSLTLGKTDLRDYRIQQNYILNNVFFPKHFVVFFFLVHYVLLFINYFTVK